MKTVSVIVPVHNAAGTLEAAVRSALSQSYSNIELILVDDGAEDGSGDLCEQFAAEDERIRVFHMEDRGVSAARNLGLDNAQGEYITFLDADDVLHPALVRTLLDLLKKTGADYAGCGFERREGDAAPFGGASSGDNTTGPIREGLQSAPPAAGDAAVFGADQTQESSGVSLQERAEASAMILCGEEIITQGILHPERPDTRIWSKIFRREYIGRRRFREGLTIGEDFLFLAQLAAEDTRYASTERQLYSYYINPNGAMERPFAPNHMDHLRCWELAEEQIRSTFPALLAVPDNAARLAARYLIAAVLTASKIARLPAAQQTRYLQQFEICRETIKEYHQTGGVDRYLPAGYNVKIKLLLHAPGLYRKLYH